MTTFVGGIAIGFTQGWQEALVLMAALPIMAGTGGWMAKNLANFAKMGERAYRSAGGVAEQAISGIRTVASLSGERREKERYSLSLEQALENGIAKARTHGLGFGIFMSSIFGTYALGLWSALPPTPAVPARFTMAANVAPHPPPFRRGDQVAARGGAAAAGQVRELADHERCGQHEQRRAVHGRRCHHGLLRRGVCELLRRAGEYTQASATTARVAYVYPEKYMYVSNCAVTLKGRRWRRLSRPSIRAALRRGASSRCRRRKEKRAIFPLLHWAACDHSASPSHPAAFDFQHTRPHTTQLTQHRLCHRAPPGRPLRHFAGGGPRPAHRQPQRRRGAA